MKKNAPCKYLSKLVKRNNGLVLPFHQLPHEAKMAMILYMAIDGEAWKQSARIKTLDRDEDVAECLRFSIHYYTKNYGGVKFGYCPKVPVSELLDSILHDADIRAGGVKTLDQLVSNIKFSPLSHDAPAKKPWPVILSSYDDETLQDGWNRFYNYVQRGRKHCPALYYV